MHCVFFEIEGDEGCQHLAMLQGTTLCSHLLTLPPDNSPIKFCMVRSIFLHLTGTLVKVHWC